MARDDWYRSETWDRAAREDFETHLARARDDHGQYLRIQGLTLLETRKRSVVNAGLELLRRVIDDWPDEHESVAGAHAHLAEYFQERDDVARAKEHFRRSISAENKLPNQSWQCGLTLAALLAADPEGQDDTEATSLLDTAIDTHAGLTVFPQLQLRYLLARSRVEHRQGRVDVAAAYALGVAEMLDEADRAAGTGQEGSCELRGLRQELEATVGAGDADAASPLVEQFRGQDGRIRWIWPLVRQLHRVPAHGDATIATSDRLIADCERELRDAGFETFHLSSWSVKSLSGAAEVRRAAAILLRHFEAHADDELRAAIANALGDPRARKVATGPLLDAFSELHSPELADESTPMTSELGAQRRLKSALGRALATLARDPEFDRLATLVRDPRHGFARDYLFWALHHVKNPEAVDLCLELMHDDDLGLSALRALTDLKSIRARPALQAIASQPTTRKRNPEAELLRLQVQIAQGGLDKLDRAVAAGKART